MNSQALGQSLVSFDTYRTLESYHAFFTKLRAEQPVAWATPESYRPFWAITKHADIKEIEFQPDKFTNAERSFLISSADEEKLAASQKAGLTAMGRSVVQLDGRDHRVLRQVTQGWFAPASIRKIEEQIRKVALTSIDEMIESGGECDFVKNIALWYPLRVILSILGLPQQDERLLLKYTTEMFAPSDPDTDVEAGVAGMIAASQGIGAYFTNVIQDRRKHPRDDVASVVANAKVDGELISDIDAIGYYITIITAGHDTTSSTTSAGLLALIENPAELAKLRAGTATVDSAVDEFLRWSTPIKHFFRTAQVDYELRGKQVRAGDSLMMCYPSGNRDEEVFAEPFEFRVDRKPNPQIAFGYGPHVCLGQHLAKLEMRVFFEELLNRFDGFKLTGGTALAETNFIQGLKAMPISFHTRELAS